MTAAKSNWFENALMKLIFQNEALAGIGDAAGLQPSATAGFIWLSLHNADPGEDGAQNTNEAFYTGYVRHNVARNDTGWTVVNHIAFNAAEIQYQKVQLIGGFTEATHLGVGVSPSGSGSLLWRGDLTAQLDYVEQQTIPTFPVGEIAIVEF